jgi:hypothetical protein
MHPSRTRRRVLGRHLSHTFTQHLHLRSEPCSGLMYQGQAWLRKPDGLHEGAEKLDVRGGWGLVICKSMGLGRCLGRCLSRCLSRCQSRCGFHQWTCDFWGDPDVWERRVEPVSEPISESMFDNSTCKAIRPLILAQGNSKH